MTLPAILTAALLGLATIAAIVRLILRHRAAGAMTGARWRFATLLILQPLAALTLYLALLPPTTVQPAGTLRIATAGTSARASLSVGSPLVALPEAGRMSGAQAMPDMATALRRYPGTRNLIILGAGLTPRDMDAARSMALSFTPPSPVSGIVALTPPTSVAPGAVFPVSGQASGEGVDGVELLDPAGRITDRTVPDANGLFRLQGTARSTGLATFTVRLKHGSRRVEQAQLPVIVTGSAKARLLIVAAAPEAEVKYLRRWAIDAGMDVSVQMQTGAGVALGDPPVSIDPVTLSRYDALVFDDRSWAALGPRRSTVLVAVANGLGLVLRPSGPIDANVRSQWQSLGFTLKGGNELAPVSLPPIRDPAIEGTRIGIGTDDQPADIALPDDPLPDINRLAVTPGGADTAPFLHDASGSTIAAWRASGTGRMAIFTPVDSYGLTLTGRRSLYEGWWSQLLSTVLRPAASPAFFDQTYWTGERAVLCGVSSSNMVRAPDGKVSQLLPVSNCAAYWPKAPGWHQVEGGGQSRPFFVYAADALPAMRSMRNAIATEMIVSDRNHAASRSSRHSLPSWPFALAWLTVSASLWWLERTRMGRSMPPQSAM